MQFVKNYFLCYNKSTLKVRDTLAHLPLESRPNLGDDVSAVSQFLSEFMPSFAMFMGLLFIAVGLLALLNKLDTPRRPIGMASLLIVLGAIIVITAIFIRNGTVPSGMVIVMTAVTAIIYVMWHNNYHGGTMLVQHSLALAGWSSATILANVALLATDEQWYETAALACWLLVAIYTLIMIVTVGDTVWTWRKETRARQTNHKKLQDSMGGGAI